MAAVAGVATSCICGCGDDPCPSLSLERFRQIAVNNIPPWAFYGVDGSLLWGPETYENLAVDEGGDRLFPDPLPWPVLQQDSFNPYYGFVGRDRMVDTIKLVEDKLLNELGFPIGPREICDTVIWPRRYDGCLAHCPIVQTNFSRISAVGNLVDEVLDTVGVVFGDTGTAGNSPGSNDIWAASAFVDSSIPRDEIFFRFPGENSCAFQKVEGAITSFTEVDVSTCRVDITGYLWLMATPLALDYPFASTGIDITTSTDNLVTELEVVRRKLTSAETGFGKFIFGCTSCGCSASGCSECREVEVCLVDGARGRVRLRNPGYCQEGIPYSVTLRYISGDCPTGWEELIARYVAAELGVGAFPLVSPFVAQWGSPITSSTTTTTGTVSVSTSTNPLGGNKGHEYVWNCLSDLRVMSGTLV